MSSEEPTLLELLTKHPDRSVIVSSAASYTPAAVTSIAGDIRRVFPQLRHAAVALQSSDPAQFLLNLVALDGFTSTLLLLPPCMPAEQRSRVCEIKQISWLLGDEGLESLAGPHQKERDDPTTWLFTTSGSTGEPKVFEHSLHSLIRKVLDPQTEKLALTWGLAYQPHRFAGMQVVLQAFSSRDSLLVPESRDIPDMAEFFRSHGATAVSATPSHWRQFLMHGGITGCKLTQITLGGEIADQAILSSLQGRFRGARISHIYASTEAGVGFSVNDGKAGFPAAWLDRKSGIQMKVSDQGTLLLRSARISPSASLAHRMTSDHYLDTQDCVEVEAERVYFVGRASGIINVGGNKVHPEEIEGVVRQIEWVKDAVALPQKSPVLGQLVSLVVQPSGSAADFGPGHRREIQAHCLQRLAKFKLPSRIVFRDTLPFAESGKIDRGAVSL